jgi:ribosome-associated protein
MSIGDYAMMISIEIRTYLSKTFRIMNDLIFEELNRIAQAIYDKKGFNILALDVRGICTLTDYFIIAEGYVDRHVQALSQAIQDEFASAGPTLLHLEGQREGDWIVLDYGDIVIHLFTPEMREKYELEELWQEGQVVDVIIDSKQSVTNKQGNV